jgi:hypothetical protein
MNKDFIKFYVDELNGTSEKKDSGKRPIYICVDFDGTIVKHDYPLIGEENPSAIDIMLEYEEKYNVKWILNTMRSGSILKKAVKWCRLRGIDFFGVNENPTQKEWTESPKPYGIFYIDDCNIGQPLIFENGERPYVDWKKTDKILRPILEGLNK